MTLVGYTPGWCNIWEFDGLKRSITDEPTLQTRQKRTGLRLMARTKR